MTFWEEVYELRKRRLIPRVWKRADLRPHLQKPNGQYAKSAVDTIPANASISLRRDEMGNYVRNRKSDPKAWRIGSPQSGEYKLVVDPEDDLDTQEKEHLLAMLRAMELRAGWSNPLRSKPVKYIRPCDPPIPADEWEAMFLEKWDARLNDRP